MPGMMETVLNIGLNDQSVRGLAKQADNERFAFDSYRRLIQMFGKTVLDMYAGSGTFSVFLADFFERVVLVEHNRDALVFAEENLRGKQHESFGLSGEKWVQYSAQNTIAQYGGFDAVVIDPPRSGMEKEVCKWLCRTHVPQIRSVSCNPSTHARDAAFLVRAGYKLTKLFLLDFYPHTAHIESLAFFEYTDEA